jgi:hypothetical protein
MVKRLNRILRTFVRGLDVLIELIMSEEYDLLHVDIPENVDAEDRQKEFDRFRELIGDARQLARKWKDENADI